jgi:hypothetical protein
MRVLNLLKIYLHSEFALLIIKVAVIIWTS